MVKTHLKVKVCGITNFEDAKASFDAGCDALGFIFCKKSPRYIAPEEAKKIIERLPKNIIKVGVFVNEKEGTVKKIAKLCRLDILQFHGNESPQFCSRFKDYRIIKAFRVKNKESLGKVLCYKPFAYLFDTFVEGTAGGTGKRFNWKMVRHVDGLKRPVFLSGGLNPDNVEKAIEAVHPEWVDVCSGVESVAGKKNHKELKKFIGLAKKGLAHGGKTAY